MPSSVPEVVNRYFALDADRDIDALVSLFAPDASVLDEGQEYRGAEAIRSWQAGAASAFSYTTTVTSAVALATDRHRVTARLDGNFPGGTAMLNFEFTTTEGRIGRLAIAP
jgi:ketosteroid isomerase-like protein